MLSKVMQDHIAHLSELRRMLIRSFLLTMIFFGFAFYFHDMLFKVLSYPFDQINTRQTLIATSIVTPFVVPIKFAFMTSILLSMPYHFFQFWRFISPGLYRHEKYVGKWVLWFGCLLFYLGVAFAYCVVLPMMFGFLLWFAPSQIQVMPDIQHYLDFVVSMSLIFGLTFEIPVLMLLLSWFGFVSYEQLKRARSYVIILAFILGMLLTPPDVISQVLLAIPMCILFELGMVLIRFLPLDKFKP